MIGDWGLGPIPNPHGKKIKLKSKIIIIFSNIKIN